MDLSYVYLDYKILDWLVYNYYSYVLFILIIFIYFLYLVIFSC